MSHSISTFRHVTDLPPILTPPKTPKTSETMAFIDHVSSSIPNSIGKKADIDNGDTATTSKDAKVLDSANPGPTVPTKILYAVKVMNVATKLPTTFEQSDEPFHLGEVSGEASERKAISDQGNKSPPIFKLLIEAKGYDKRRAKMYSFDPSWMDKTSLDADSDSDYAEAHQSKSKTQIAPPKLEDMKFTKILETKMEIYSHCLLEAIREVVDYYPTQNLSGETVIIHEPYWVLVHHSKELNQLHTSLKEKTKDSTGSDSENTDKEKAEHLKVLLDFIQPHIDSILLPIERRLLKKVPSVTFDDLWFLLRPGTFAYWYALLFYVIYQLGNVFENPGAWANSEIVTSSKYDDEWIGCVIMHVKQKEANRHTHVRKYNILVWFLDGKEGGLMRGFTASGKDGGKHYIYQFEGEMDVTALNIIPVTYWDAVDGGARRKSFEDRGLKKMQLLKSSHKQMTYKGDSLETRRRTYHSSLIVDNGKDLQVVEDSPTVWYWSSTNTLIDDEWMNSKGRTDIQHQSRLAELLTIKDNDIKNVSKSQCFLLVPSMLGFALDIKSWMYTHVERMHDIVQDKNPAKPIMDESHLQIIKALSHGQIGSKTTWAADSIKNKGNGVIILLHGPPGVGKTFSVECTSIAIGRPLLALTIADIGAKEDKIETELASWFYLAERWRAVLLIDEADIFLETRKHTDIARNGIVSAFLRKMDYFSGLLFLTTNRIGHIDEAFMSRVHVIIEYPPFDDATRQKIWQGFLDKLRADTGGQIRLSGSAKTYVMQSADALKIKLNGREIRNALQTAIALAQFEAQEDPDYNENEVIKVEQTHFERVFVMSRSFRKYLDGIKNDDTEQRAANIYGRNDNP